MGVCMGGGVHGCVDVELGVQVGVGEGRWHMGVADGVGVSVGVAVAVGVSVGVEEAVGVSVGVEEAVAVGVNVGVAVGTAR